MARNGGNETLLQNGVNILDEVDKIVCRSNAERENIIETFKRHGYETLPDGRTIEEVITVSRRY